LAPKGYINDYEKVIPLIFISVTSIFVRLLSPAEMFVLSFWWAGGCGIA